MAEAKRVSKLTLCFIITLPVDTSQANGFDHSLSHARSPNVGGNCSSRPPTKSPVWTLLAFTQYSSVNNGPIQRFNPT
jgi:hypothetical protein